MLVTFLKVHRQPTVTRSPSLQCQDRQVDKPPSVQQETKSFFFLEESLVFYFEGLDLESKLKSRKRQ